MNRKVELSPGSTVSQRRSISTAYDARGSIVRRGMTYGIGGITGGTDMMPRISGPD